MSSNADVNGPGPGQTVLGPSNYVVLAFMHNMFGSCMVSAHLRY